MILKDVWIAEKICMEAEMFDIEFCPIYGKYGEMWITYTYPINKIRNFLAHHNKKDVKDLLKTTINMRRPIECSPENR